MKTLSEKTFSKKLEERWNIQSQDYELLSPYLGWDKKIKIKCNHCGIIQESQATCFLSKSRKNFCKCSEASDQWKEKNDLFQDWVKKQKKYEIIDNYKGYRSNILVKCKKCGEEQKRSISSLLKDDSCLICEKKCNIKKTTTQFSKELYEKFGDEYSIVGEYKGANNSILLRHNRCGKIYSTKPHNILCDKGGLCPKCKIKSKGEIKIADYLQKNNISFISQKRFDLLKRMPYDFYIPQNNLLIEYQGQQHFFPVQNFGGEKSFIRQQEIDKIKKDFAILNGYDFLEISYKDFQNIESILAQRLSLLESKI